MKDNSSKSTEGSSFSTVDSLPAQPSTQPSLFPLRLAPFEAYMLCDDRRDYPMHFFFRMVFCGRLDRDSFVRSLQWSIARHPLMRATVRRRFGRASVWNERLHIWLRDSEHGFQDLLEVSRLPSIDLTAEPGLRVWLFQSAEHVDVLFQFHHACCDGVGALSFLQDVIIEYHGMVTGDDRTCATATQPPLRARTKLRLTTWEALRKIPYDIADYLRIAVRRPVGITSWSNGYDIAKADEALSNYCSHEFSVTELEGLLGTARRHETTLNNVVLHDLYRSIDCWLRRQTELRTGWIRILVPMSLRDTAVAQGPCCNQVTLMFLDQHSKQIQDARLLDRIARQTTAHRKSKRTHTFLQTLGLLAAVPPLLRLAVGTNRRMCTTVLSNVGRVFAGCPLPSDDGRIRTGDLMLESIDLLVPPRPGTDVTFGLLTYANRLRLCMHYKLTQLADSQVNELFRLVVESIQKSASVSRECEAASQSTHVDSHMSRNSADSQD